MTCPECGWGRAGLAPGVMAYHRLRMHHVQYVAGLRDARVN